MTIPGFTAELSAGGNRGRYAGSRFAHSPRSASLRLQLRKSDATTQACCCGTGTDQKCIEACGSSGLCSCDEKGTPYCRVVLSAAPGFGVGHFLA